MTLRYSNSIYFRKRSTFGSRTYVIITMGDEVYVETRQALVPDGGRGVLE